MKPERLAQMFHETYERLAPEYGYKTREESAVPWEAVPEANKKLMIAVCGEILAKLETPEKKRRILIADDDESVRRVVVDVLSAHRSDLAFYEASNGRIGARLVLERSMDLTTQIHLVISDWQMPEFDGIKMVHKIARIGDTTHIIMMTSEKDKLIERLLEEELMGEVHGIFEKPLDFDALCKVVDYLLPKQEG
jgi:CheY-like chemotaxis protein